MNKLYKELANCIRFLSIDAVQKANSGHPGMPMGMADIAVSLWKNNLKHNPANPKWINRDRFVLSNGHGSMLLYSLLHLTGYDVQINDLKDLGLVYVVFFISALFHGAEGVLIWTSMCLLLFLGIS